MALSDHIRCLYNIPMNFILVQEKTPPRTKLQDHGPKAGANIRWFFKLPPNLRTFFKKKFCKLYNPLFPKVLREYNF
jgi:hypothetical protein